MSSPPEIEYEDTIFVTAVSSSTCGDLQVIQQLTVFENRHKSWRSIRRTQADNVVVCGRRQAEGTRWNQELTLPVYPHRILHTALLYWLLSACPCCDQIQVLAATMKGKNRMNSRVKKMWHANTTRTRGYSRKQESPYHMLLFLLAASEDF